MHSVPASLLSLAVFALAACSLAPSPPTVTPTLTASATPRPSATPTPTRTLLPSPTSPSAEMCKRPSFVHLGFGFPRSEHRLPSLGKVNAIVLFADFSDAPATSSPQDVFAMISPMAEEFFVQQSYGRFELELEPYFTWLRLSQLSAHYGDSLTEYYRHLAFLQEAVDLADPQVDFSQTDMVVLVNNPDAYEIVYGPTYTGFLDSGLTADGNIIPNGMTSGRDLLHWGYLWLNHETGHSLGLPDLYAYGLVEDIFPYTGGYSVMGNIYGHTPELTAIERWVLGWLDDEQVYCLPAGQEVELELSAIEQPGGLKALVTPLDASRLLVVESRRALGYDQYMPEPGALVYIIDPNVPSGYGPMLVVPELEDDYAFAKSTLRLGEAVTVEGITIRVLGSGPDYDRIELRITP
ncbi:MAG: hypothetical protein KIT08_02920 [Anaerolineales bacterium]|nr:MAG: hypothetical protein KIT08_02920 [Anaerolineales bacterium]